MFELQKTSDYSIFKLLDYNRGLDIPNLDRIVASLKIKNMLHLRPILVRSDMAVLDGQHRLEAAKKLGVEIFYQIQEEAEDEDIILLNANQKGWETADYLNHYAKKGNPNYVEFLRFSKEYEVSFDLLRIMLYGSEHAIMTKVRSGTIIFGDKEKKEAQEKLWSLGEVLKVISRLCLEKGTFLRSSRMKISIIDFLSIDDVALDIFLKKLSIKFDCIHPCASRAAYMQMFKGIYNWKNQQPVE